MNAEYRKARDAAACEFADELYDRYNGSLPNPVWIERQTTWMCGADWGREYESQRATQSENVSPKSETSDMYESPAVKAMRYALERIASGGYTFNNMIEFAETVLEIDRAERAGSGEK